MKIATLTAPDYVVMRRINRSRPPRWIRWWMIGATRGGDGWLWALLGVLLLCRFDRLDYIATASASSAIVAGILLFRFLKRRIARPRPCALEPCSWTTLAPPDQFSFPSGHSITAFAFSVPVSLCFPALSLPLLFLACSVALSRIVLGMHFLSDVIAGVLIGSLLGYVSYCVFAANL